MKNWHVWAMLLLMVTTALSGCGKKTDDPTTTTGPGPVSGDTDPSTLTTEDHALGNKGYRIGGGPTGTATALDASVSAVQLDVADKVDSDRDVTDTNYDRADFVLVAQETGGKKIEATFKSMAVGGAPDNRGGISLNVDVFGTTGRVVNGPPQAKAYIYAVGMAALKIDGAAQAGTHLVHVAMTQGVRGADGASATSADATDLEIHIYFPGASGGAGALSGIPEGWLYYYFELVRAEKLSAEKKLEVGKGLDKPQRENVAPQAVGRFLVGGAVVTNATKEGATDLVVEFDASLSTDSDGTVQVWVWRVAEPNATGALPSAGDPAIRVFTGENVEVNFTKPGPKFIELVVRDDRQKTSVANYVFYVDHHIVSGFTSTQLQPAGGGNSCVDALNCNKHDINFDYGLESAVFTIKKKSDPEPTGWHIQVHKPGNTDPAKTDDKVGEVAGKSLTLDKTKLGTPGRYRVWVWWQAGTQVSYDLDVRVSYTPSLGSNSTA